jgi:DNA-binding response OmpR family regulator
VTLCPCCRQPVPEDIGLTVSLDENAILYRGNAVRLCKVETEIMSVLEDSHPGWASKEHILARVYAHGEHPQDKTIGVHLTHVRRKLRDGKLPIDIQNSWYHGGGGHAWRLRLE